MRTPQLRPNTGRTILVVDDNPSVLKYICSCLTNKGYRVLSAGSPEAARQIDRDATGLIDLLLSDVIMRRTSGPDLAAEVQQRRPAMRVILISGSPDDIRLKSFTGALLVKPFLAGELLGAVAAALSEGVMTATP